MNVLADEGVDRSIVEQLRADGHDVVYIAELSPSITDEEVLDLANTRGALLITADKDFGEIVFRLRQAHTGVLLLRLAGLSSGSKAKIVSGAVKDHELELFSVIDAAGIRIRKSPWRAYQCDTTYIRIFTPSLSESASEYPTSYARGNCSQPALRLNGE